MKKAFVFSLISLSLTAFFAISVTLVLAAHIEGHTGTIIEGETTGTGPITLQNPFACGQNCTLFTLLRNVINDILLPIGGVLAVLAFIYSGFLYVVAQGNETKLKTANRALLYTSVGTAILLGSWVIAQVIETTINQLR